MTPFWASVVPTVCRDSGTEMSDPYLCDNRRGPSKCPRCSGPRQHTHARPGSSLVSVRHLYPLQRENSPARALPLPAGSARNRARRNMQDRTRLSMRRTIAIWPHRTLTLVNQVFCCSM